MYGDILFAIGPNFNDRDPSGLHGDGGRERFCGFDQLIGGTVRADEALNVDGCRGREYPFEMVREIRRWQEREHASSLVVDDDERQI